MKPWTEESLRKFREDPDAYPPLEMLQGSSLKLIRRWFTTVEAYRERAERAEAEALRADGEAYARVADLLDEMADMFTRRNDYRPGSDPHQAMLNVIRDVRGLAKTLRPAASDDSVCAWCGGTRQEPRAIEGFDGGGLYSMPCHRPFHEASIKE